MTGDPKTDREFQVWEHGRQQGLAEGTRAVLRYILAHGWEVSLGEIAKATGLTAERVAAVLDEIKESRHLTLDEQRIMHRALRRSRRIRCTECGVSWADHSSRLCPGCEAYREHTGAV